MILGSSNNTIGGTTPRARNLISGNSHIGVDIFEGATGNLVEGNFIGTNAVGVSLGNGGDGVLIHGSGFNTTVGGRPVDPT